MNNAHSKEDEMYEESRGHVALQHVKDKMARNNGWSVCFSKFNFDTKCIDYLIAINDDKFGEKHVSFEEVCRDFGWKDFRVSENQESIFPVKE